MLPKTTVVNTTRERAVVMITSAFLYLSSLILSTRANAMAPLIMPAYHTNINSDMLKLLVYPKHSASFVRTTVPKNLPTIIMPNSHPMRPGDQTYFVEAKEKKVSPRYPKTKASATYPKKL